MTERELEVLGPIVRGLSNAESADRLAVGQATVEIPIGHLVAKLEAPYRVQVVIAACEAGLVGARSRSGT